MMRKTLAFLAVGGCAFFLTRTAEAQDFDPWFGASRAFGYADVWPAENFTAALFGAELQLRVANRVFLDMSFNGAVAEHDVLTGNDVRAAYGNLTIGAHYAGSITRRFDFFVGGTFTPPLLHDPDVDVATVAGITRYIRGYYDMDRLLAGHLAIRGMGGFEWNPVNPLYLRAELRPVVYVPTRDTLGGIGVSGRDAELLLEHAFELEGRFRNGFGFGARFQGVALVTNDGGDQAQIVFEPFIQLTPRRRGFYMRLGFPLALDEPLGFGLDDNKLATGRIALGGQW